MMRLLQDERGRSARCRRATLRHVGLGALGLLLAAPALHGCVSSDPNAPPEQLVVEGASYAPYEPSTDGAMVTSSSTQVTAVEADSTPLPERTREELALALRPAILHSSGELYLAEEPSWEAADALLGGQESPPHMMRPSGEPPPTGGTGGTAAALILGDTDDRDTSADTTVAPHHAISRVLLYADVEGKDARGWCTASFVGTYTVLLAAHCLRFPDGALARRIELETARQGDALPNGSVRCVNGDESSTNDFSWTMPAGYLLGADPAFDFAVLNTYGCTTAPNHFDGYIVNAQSPGGVEVYGYSVEPCNGVPDLDAYESGTYLCGMGGTATQSEWRLQSSDIDTDSGWACCPDTVAEPPPRGMSGAPWYAERNGSGGVSEWFVAGTDIGFAVVDNVVLCGLAQNPCVVNVARRLDDTYDQFIQHASFEF